MTGVFCPTGPKPSRPDAVAHTRELPTRSLVPKFPGRAGAAPPPGARRRTPTRPIPLTIPQEAIR